jgi:phage terminase large subunit-like protein
VALHVPPRSPALAWRDDLTAAGVTVVEVKQAAFIEAQQALEQAVAEGTLRHRGQPEMNTAVKGLAARVAGDSSPWSRRSSGANVAPLFAAAAAVAAQPVAVDEFYVY